jgi:DNA-binding transcriptional LysR family regulator
MDLELRHLRCLIAIVDSGGFTDAAVGLGISQPAVSRTLAALETVLGARLLRRTSREIVLTAAGERVLARARRVLAEVEELAREAKTGDGRLRIGHAWAAMGVHTLDFQRRWTERHPDISLHLVRTNSPTGGLAEGACDMAVVRTPPDTAWPDTVSSVPSRFDTKRFDRAVVGLESRYCALAADDPMARRRQVRLSDLSGRVLAVDPRTGTTTPELWPPGDRWTTGSPSSPPVAASGSPPRARSPNTDAPASSSAACATPRRSPSG